MLGKSKANVDGMWNPPKVCSSSPFSWTAALPEVEMGNLVSA